MNKLLEISLNNFFEKNKCIIALVIYPKIKYPDQNINLIYIYNRVIIYLSKKIYNKLKILLRKNY